MANPFALLFQSEGAASLREEAAVKDNNDLSALLMRIFLFTGSGMYMEALKGQNYIHPEYKRIMLFFNY